MTLIRAPIAPRFDRVPVSLRSIQALPWPWFSNSRIRCRSPGVAPPTSNSSSSSPSSSRSAKATPWPLCSSPVPEDEVTSTKARPPRFRSSTLGTSEPPNE
jgi:hypothetical protein